MSAQLDYEATRAALRAQVYGTADVGHHVVTRTWKWYGIATSVVVISCAVVLTLWVTAGGSVTLIPSGEGSPAQSHGSSAPTSTSSDATTSIPGAPVRQVLLQPDGTVVLDAAGVPVVVTTPEAAEAAVARGFLLRPATTPEELAAPATPAAVITAKPRPKPPAPSNGGGTPQPSPPPTNGGGTGTPSTGGGPTEPTPSTPPSTVPSTDPNPPASTGPADPPVTSPVDPPPAGDPPPAPPSTPDPPAEVAAAATEPSSS